MKKLTLCLLLVGVFLFSHSANAQVRFGVKAGVNTSNVRHDLYDSNPLLGYQGGLMADIRLSSKFSIQPALLFVTKGFRSELEFRDQQGQSTGTYQSIFRTNYLKLPVLVLLKTEVSKSFRFFVGLGPYLAVGINGKFDIGSGLPIQNIKFGPKNDRPEGTYNRMDYGLATVAGVEMGRFSLAINYGHGLTGIAATYIDRDVPVFCNRSLGLTAGYWFGKVKP